MTTIHVVGEKVTTRARTVQRCGWCGALLANLTEAEAARGIEVPEGTPVPPTYPFWPPGDLVGMPGGSWLPLDSAGNDADDDGMEWCLDEDPA